MWNVLASTGPGARAWNQVAYDGRLLIAGGSVGAGAYHNDFWAFEAGAWVKKIPYAPSAEPVSREHQAFVHCPKDGKTYWFNGHTGTAANNWATWPQRKKIWRLSGDAWEDTGKVIYQPELGPGEWAGNPMRMSAATVWCPPLDGFLIMGGANWQPDRTYLLRHADLVPVRIAPTSSFAPGSMRFNVNNQGAWIPELNKAVLFGGQDTTTNGRTLNDLNLYDPISDTWATQITVNPPPGRSEGCIVYRPGKLAAFGGINRLASGGAVTYLRDLWELDLGSWVWTRLEDAPTDFYWPGGFWDGTQYLFAGGYSNASSSLSGSTLAYTLGGAPVTTPINVPQALNVGVF